MEYTTASHRHDITGYEKLYLICPKRLYGSAWYLNMRKSVGDLCKKAYVMVTPIDLYATHRAWKEIFPILLDIVQAVVLVPDQENAIGRGCYDEVTEADRAGKPVYVLFMKENSAEGVCCVHPSDEVTIVLTHSDYQRYAILEHVALHKAEEEELSPPVEVAVAPPTKPRIQDQWTFHKPLGRPPKH